MQPPPEPPIPQFEPAGDRAVHGSLTIREDPEGDGWCKINSKNASDYAKSVTETAIAKGQFIQNGWDFALDVYNFYLADHPEGSIYYISYDNQIKTIRNDAVSKKIKKGMDDIVKEARDNALNDRSLFGVPQGITAKGEDDAPPGYRGWYSVNAITDDGDLANALGGHWVAVGADVTVYKPGSSKQKYPLEPRESMLVTMRYTPYIYDFYYFHGTATSIKGKYADRESRYLEEFGYARSFRVRGYSVVEEWEGHTV